MPTLGSFSPCQDASSSQLSFLLAGAWGIPVPMGIAQTFNLPSLETTAATGLRQEVARVGFPWWKGGRETQIYTVTSHTRSFIESTFWGCAKPSRKNAQNIGSQAPQPFFRCIWIQLQQWQRKQPFLIPIKWSIPYAVKASFHSPNPSHDPQADSCLVPNSLIRSLKSHDGLDNGLKMDFDSWLGVAWDQYLLTKSLLNLWAGRNRLTVKALGWASECRFSSQHHHSHLGTLGRSLPQCVLKLPTISST